MVPCPLYGPQHGLQLKAWPWPILRCEVSTLLQEVSLDTLGGKWTLHVLHRQGNVRLLHVQMMGWVHRARGHCDETDEQRGDWNEFH